MSAELKARTVYRSAITGRFVTRAYAEAHPDTTVSQTIWIEQRPAVPVR